MLRADTDVLMKQSLEQWSNFYKTGYSNIIETFNVNLLSPIILTRELLRSNKISKGGAIIYLSSINGIKVGTKAHTCYSATKAGIAGFVMSLANELSTSGIRVNAVAPAAIW